MTAKLMKIRKIFAMGENQPKSFIIQHSSFIIHYPPHLCLRHYIRNDFYDNEKINLDTFAR